MLKHPRPSFRSVYRQMQSFGRRSIRMHTVATVIAGMWIMGLLLRDGVGDADGAHGG